MTARPLGAKAIRTAARRAARPPLPWPRLAGPARPAPGFAAPRATGRRFDCLRAGRYLMPQPLSRRRRGRAPRGARPHACRTTLPFGRATQART